MRGATTKRIGTITRPFNFYSRTSCEVRLNIPVSVGPSANFYSRTSCEVRQYKRHLPILLEYNFYSRTSCEVRPFDSISITHLLVIFLLTHLMRGATFKKEVKKWIIFISTHAPHARCDKSKLRPAKVKANFYSRTSCEVRRFKFYLIFFI